MTEHFPEAPDAARRAFPDNSESINMNAPINHSHLSVVPLPQRAKKKRPVLTGWLTGAVKDMNDNIVPNVANALLGLRQADQRASERSFHPIRDHLSTLKWDGKPRIAGWLSNYLGAERTPYHSSIGR